MSDSIDAQRAQIIADIIADLEEYEGELKRGLAAVSLGLAAFKADPVTSLVVHRPEAARPPWWRRWRIFS